MKRLLFLSILLFATSNLTCQRTDDPGVIDLLTSFTISDGEDWDFPSWVQPKFRSGFGIMGKFSTNPIVRHAGTTLTWAMLNPAEGIYDFSNLEKWLNDAKAKNGLVLFRLKASVMDRKSPWPKEDGSFIPPWVVEKHRPASFYTRQEENGNHLLYAAPWDPGVQQEFKRFVEEFNRRRYFENDNLLAVYLHGISSSYGEEFYIDRSFTPQLLQVGLTKEGLVGCFKDRMDWWANAAGIYNYKLAWVGAEAIQDFDFPKEELNNYAFAKGYGIRGGFIEHYFYGPVSPPNAGQHYENGYVVVDYNHFMHDGRFFGDECEEDDEFGDAKGAELAFMQQSCFYQAARVGINFLWVSDKNLAWAPEVAKWYSMVAGKNPEESPDASCWLREAYVKDINGDKQVRVWKNFERLLMQRDSEGATTVPAERFELNSKNNGWIKDPNRRYEYSARKTNAAYGQKKMNFFLDERFEQSLKEKAAIKITYLDNSFAKWHLTVSCGAETLKFGLVEGKNDYKWKTVTFQLEKKICRGALPSGGAFSVEVIGLDDLTVKHARVVKMD